MKKNTTETETYAVYHLEDSGKQPKEIAKILNIGIKTVKDIISARKVVENENIPTTSSKTTNKNLMIRETSVKRNKSVAIMTKEASEINDAFKKNLDHHIQSRTSKNAIYRPNSDK
jgi:transposase